jgi:hypothetical protein
MAGRLFKYDHPEAFLELGDASQHGRVVHTEALGGSSHRAAARDGKKVANVIPVIMVQSSTAGLPSKARVQHRRTSSRMWGSTGGDHSLCRQARPNSERRTPIVAAGVSRPAGSISHHRCARFRTQRLTPADPCRGSRGLPERPKAEPERKSHGKA